MKYYLIIAFTLTFFYSCNSQSSKTDSADLKYLTLSKQKILYNDESSKYYIYDIKQNKDYFLTKFSLGNFPVAQLSKFTPSGDKICFLKTSSTFRGLLIYNILTNEIKEIPLKISQSSCFTFKDQNSLFFTSNNKVYLYSFSENSINLIVEVNTLDILDIYLSPHGSYLAITSLVEKEKNSFYTVIDFFNVKTANIEKTIETEFIGWMNDKEVCIKDSIYKTFDLITNKINDIAQNFDDSLMISDLINTGSGEYILIGGTKKAIDLDVSDRAIYLYKDSKTKKIFTYELLKKNFCDIFYKY